MRARRAAIIWALLAFVLGVALGPVLGWERQTVVVDEGSGVIPGRLAGLPAAGWTVARSDVASSDVRLITFERPRLVALTKSAGDAFNTAADWLAWATGTGRHSRR